MAACAICPAAMCRVAMSDAITCHAIMCHVEICPEIARHAITYRATICHATVYLVKSVVEYVYVSLVVMSPEITFYGSFMLRDCILVGCLPRSQIPRR